VICVGPSVRVFVRRGKPLCVCVCVCVGACVCVCVCVCLCIYVHMFAMCIPIYVFNCSGIICVPVPGKNI